MMSYSTRLALGIQKTLMIGLGIKQAQFYIDLANKQVGYDLLRTKTGFILYPTQPSHEPYYASDEPKATKRLDFPE